MIRTFLGVFHRLFNAASCPSSSSSLSCPTADDTDPAPVIPPPVPSATGESPIGNSSGGVSHGMDETIIPFCLRSGADRARSVLGVRVLWRALHSSLHGPSRRAEGAR